MGSTIVLMTDFGMTDIYVGVMKGVIRQICPDARVIDLTHNVRPQQVRQAAFELMNAIEYFPEGTIFNVVVDPGVGTQRRSIAVKTDKFQFVAPDNGVLSYVLDTLGMYQVVELLNTQYHLAKSSYTFHGRDVFSPVAAHLACGVALEDLGNKIGSVLPLPLPTCIIEADCIVGEVLHIDHFGNIVTSIGRGKWIDPAQLILTPTFVKGVSAIRIGVGQSIIKIGQSTSVGIKQTYGEAKRGEVIALVGSSGFVEVAMNQGNAAEKLNVTMGDHIQIQLGGIDAAIHH